MLRLSGVDINYWPQVFMNHEPLAALGVASAARRGACEDSLPKGNTEQRFPVPSSSSRGEENGDFYGDY